MGRYLLLTTSAICAILLGVWKSDVNIAWSSVIMDGLHWIHYNLDPYLILVVILVASSVHATLQLALKSRIPEGEIKEQLDRKIKEWEQAQTARVSNLIKKHSSTVQRIDQKIEALVSEHPWIVGLSEHGLLPEVPLCRIILISCKDYLRSGKPAFVAEFIYASLTDSGKSARSSEMVGTLDDFRALADFCEGDLKDAQLSLLVLGYGCRKHPSGVQLLPEYCRRLLARGDYVGAGQAAWKLARILDIPYYQRLVRYNCDVEFLNGNIGFLNRALPVVALYFAAVGDIRRERRYLRRLQSISCGLTSRSDEHWASLERAIFARRTDEIRIHVSKIRESCTKATDIPSMYEYLVRAYPEIRIEILGA